MITAVSVGLGILDIILDLQHSYIVLRPQNRRDLVNIIDKGTDDTNPCHIVQVVQHGIHRDRISPALQLFHDAPGLFYPGLDHLNGIVGAAHCHLIIEHIQLRAHLPDGTVVHHHQLLEFPQLSRKIVQILCDLRIARYIFCQILFIHVSSPSGRIIRRTGSGIRHTARYL